MFFSPVLQNSFYVEPCQQTPSSLPHLAHARTHTHTHAPCTLSQCHILKLSLFLSHTKSQPVHLSDSWFCFQHMLWYELVKYQNLPVNANPASAAVKCWNEANVEMIRSSQMMLISGWKHHATQWSSMQGSYRLWLSLSDKITDFFQTFSRPGTKQIGVLLLLFSSQTQVKPNSF